MTTVQLSLDEAIERANHITRLTRSMEHWREQELDQRLPELYAHYCGVLGHLRAGGSYIVRTYSADDMLKMGRAERDATPVGAFVKEIAAGFAAVSRARLRGA